jgi:hypothetical protein
MINLMLNRGRRINKPKIMNLLSTWAQVTGMTAIKYLENISLRRAHRLFAFIPNDVAPFFCDNSVRPCPSEHISRVQNYNMIPSRNLPRQSQVSAAMSWIAMASVVYYEESIFIIIFEDKIGNSVVDLNLWSL